LHARNPLVLQGGDVLFRMLLFWSIFLPLGARCSLDALRRRSAEPLPDRVSSPCTLALMLQVCFVYWFAAAIKSDPVWRHEGSAGNAAHRPYYAASLLREWNRHHAGEERLESLAIYFMLEVTLPDYQAPRPEKVLLCEYPTGSGRRRAPMTRPHGLVGRIHKA
jgi:hypothetical protein